MIPENIHTHTTGGILEFQGRGRHVGGGGGGGGEVMQFEIPKAWVFQLKNFQRGRMVKALLDN